jgi:hypothetical protein
VAGVPGAGLEPARPEGPVRFKLTVSAFHHPGEVPDRPKAYGPPRAHSEPIRVLPPDGGSADRSCLILLGAEGPPAQ